MSNFLAPSVSLIVKLGSIAVHAEEFLSNDGHEFDRVALTSLLCDVEIRNWLALGDAMAMLPKKRKL
jgi:hypothetical protein